MNALPSMPLAAADRLPLANATKQQLGLVYTTVFEHLGYFTTPGKGRSIHGIDFILYKPDFSEPEIAMRCRPDDSRVDENSVTRFWETVTSRGYSRAIFVTNKEFSPSAQEFMAGRDLLLIDAVDLERGLDDLPQSVRQSIIRCLGAIREINLDPPSPVSGTSSKPVTQQAQTQADAPHHTPEQSSPATKAAQLNDLTPSHSNAPLPAPTGTWEKKMSSARKKRVALTALAPVALVAATVLLWNFTNGSQSVRDTPAAPNTAAAKAAPASTDDSGILGPAALQYLAEMDFEELKD